MRCRQSSVLLFFSSGPVSSLLLVPTPQLNCSLTFSEFLCPSIDEKENKIVVFIYCVLKFIEVQRSHLSMSMIVHFVLLCHKIEACRRAYTRLVHILFCLLVSNSLVGGNITRQSLNSCVPPWSPILC